MVTLSGFQFKTEDGAQQAIHLIEKFQRQALIQVQDAGIITWPIASKKPNTRHLNHLSGVGALGGAFWGSLFGLIFSVPFFGMATGAVTGAFAGSFGITPYFIDSVRRKVTEGTSAVILLTSGEMLDKILLVTRSLPSCELISTNLSKEQEVALRAAFAEEEEVSAGV